MSTLEIVLSIACALLSIVVVVQQVVIRKKRDQIIRMKCT